MTIAGNAYFPVCGDGEEIPAPDNTFWGCTVAFGVRNLSRTQQGLNEMYRVLKPGGKLLILEFSRPTNPVVKPLYSVLPEQGPAENRRSCLRRQGGIRIPGQFHRRLLRTGGTACHAAIGRFCDNSTPTAYLRHRNHLHRGQVT